MSDRAATIRERLHCGRRADALLSGRHFKARLWDAADADLVALEAELAHKTKVLERIASTDEMTGDGPVEAMIDPPVGPAAHELRARINRARAVLSREEKA